MTAFWLSDAPYLIFYAIHAIALMAYADRSQS